MEDGDSALLVQSTIREKSQYTESELTTRAASLRLDQCTDQLRCPPSTPLKLVPGFESELKFQAEKLARLHHRVSRVARQEVPSKYDLAFLMQTIAASCISLQLASVIARAILRFLQSRNARMTRLRASVEKSFTDEDLECPIVEWNESDGTDIIALFHFDDAFEPEECSWAMHLGVGRSSPNSKGPLWQSSRVDWNVANVSHLKTIFGIAQHILGVLQWPIADALRVSGDNVSDTYSEEETTRYDQLLLEHLQQLKGLEASFDKLAPVLQSLGRTEVVSPSGDRRYWRCGLTLYI